MNNIAVNSISCIFSEDVSNESFVINCNSKFLLDILSHIDSKIVRFAILDNKSPILVRPVDDNDVRYIFMPMF